MLSLGIKLVFFSIAYEAEAKAMSYQNDRMYNLLESELKIDYKNVLFSVKAEAKAVSYPNNRLYIRV